MKVAILGLGEAGSAIASDLARTDHSVIGYDPAPRQSPAGVELKASIPDAVRGADLVLSINLSSVSEEVARAARPAAHAAQVFADLNTSSPQTKRLVAAALPAGVLFADVALLASVPGKGLRTPALASGPGAQAFGEMLGPLGMPVTVVDSETGRASSLKLVRSIFMKGLAAAVIECLEAARRLDSEEWAREQVLTVLGDDALLDRLVAGSRIHAERRIQEMEAVRDLLGEVGVEPYIASAAIQRLEALRDEA